MKAPLILIDGSSYFFRAFHALPPLTNSKGQPTGAVYGVANMIKKLIKDYQPEELAVVFDAKGKTFRDEWYPEYKAHRPPMPVELSSQFQPLIQLLQAMGLPLLIVDGVEADDVIGTLAHQATQLGLPVVISTGDKDMAQLVNEHVSLINTMSNYSMDVAGVKEKFGVTPEQIIDYLTLVGDSVDNVPGVTKCGPKTAVKWLEEYKTLDNLIHHAEAIGGKIGEHLRACIPHLALSKKLVTIKTDLELPLTLDDLKPKPADKEQLIELTRELEFKNWLKELLGQEENQPAPTDEPNTSYTSYEIITTNQQLNHWLNKLEQCPVFSVDTETTSLDVMVAEIVGVSMAIEEGKGVYIPLIHTDGSPQLEREEVLTALKPILENPDIKKIGQNIKYDYGVFKNHGITLKGIAYDTMLESYVLNSSAGRHDMDTLALKYLGVKTISFEEIAGKGAKQLRFDQIPVAKAGIYAAEDADITLQLHHKLYPMMDEPLREVLQTIEMPLLTVLADMERYGVLIDPITLKTHGNRLKERIGELENEALQLAGRPFNLNSPKQLQEILFDELKLPVIAKTPTGQPSTAESVLQELAFDFRLAAVILEYRGLTKLVSTYIDALPKKINPITHRVHTSYNQAVAATGRLSSSEPNLQNIPIRSEEGRLIRTAFIAPPGCVILAADYSQIELRIMAHLSQDPNLLKAFANGWDIHAATASEIFQTPLDQVTSEQRRKSKAVNFGLIYGMSAFGLAKQIGVDRQDAQHYIDTYFQRYPGVLEYMERTRKQAHQLGYVETLFGRRLYLPEINARNMMRQKAAERMAINAPMQGTAADIIKKTMLAVANWQNSQINPPARMIMQVHDELVFEVRHEEVESCTKIIHNLMEHTVELSVPLLVSIGTGANWDDAH
ncbi:DNA polymerase I [Legionella bononiensis]|uniref:DNA polymerase I n=1 Tax=Legionella bononiensis TaxID=2793102 RepID=A0ABS1WDR1_9GAMM|nr:DNA polymerase I [Legionella bononiensis]MBL7481469.1 DNA polymerase I [Legionella bononiensis]MBL7527501.1 DNA polymerase I [Legionella bononiensis]